MKTINSNPGRRIKNLQNLCPLQQVIDGFVPLILSVCICSYLRSKKNAFKIFKILVNADKGGFSQMKTFQTKSRDNTSKVTQNLYLQMINVRPESLKQPRSLLNQRFHTPWEKIQRIGMAEKMAKCKKSEELISNCRGNNAFFYGQQQKIPVPGCPCGHGNALSPASLLEDIFDPFVKIVKQRRDASQLELRQLCQGAGSSAKVRSIASYSASMRRR